MGQSEIASLTPQSFISFGDVAHVEYSETPGNHRGNLTFNMVSLLIGRLRRAYLYCTQYSIPSISRKIPTAADFWPDSPPTIVGASLARSPCLFFFLPGEESHFQVRYTCTIPRSLPVPQTGTNCPWNTYRMQIQQAGILKVVGREMPE